MPVRKAPTCSASECALKTKRKGHDGKMWEVCKTSAGVKRWKRCSPKKKKGGAEEKKETKKRTKASPEEKKEKKKTARPEGERKEISQNILTKEEWKVLEDQSPVLRKLRLDIRHRMKKCGQMFIIVANKQVGDTWERDYSKWESPEFFKTPWMLGELQVDSKRKKILNPVIRIVHGLNQEQKTCVYDILKRELADAVAWEDSSEKAILVDIMGGKAR